MSITTYNWSINASNTTYWYYKPYCFTDSEINRINLLADQLPAMGGVLADDRTDSKVRTSSMKFIPSSENSASWLFEKLTHSVLSVNNQYFNFDLQAIESLQYTVYNTGSFYKEHVDTLPSNYNGMRKLSFVLMLSDPSEYSGGDLVLRYGNTVIAPKAKGTLLFFPSYTLHEVTPVIKGTRKTLVGWVQGPNFK